MRSNYYILVTTFCYKFRTHRVGVSLGRRIIRYVKKMPRQYFKYRTVLHGGIRKNYDSTLKNYADSLCGL